MKLILFLLLTLPMVAHAEALPVPKTLPVEEMLTGKKVELEIYGKKQDALTVVLFWASWCEYCKEFAGELTKIHDRNPNLIQVIGIATDDTKEPASRSAQTTYRIIKKQYWYPKAGSKTYYPKVLPTIVLFDKDGRIDTIYEGSQGDKINYFKKRLLFLDETAGKELATY